jgi:HTH-type transcriptional regulator/antitoxin HigA
MRIQPIRTEAAHEAAVARIRELMGSERGSEGSDELEILVTLVDVYEAMHFPISQPDPVTVIKFQMEQQGLSRKDLEPLIGSRARVSEILTGKRPLTLPMIRRLHHGLRIPVDLLVGTVEAPSRLTRQAHRKGPIPAVRRGRSAAIRQSAR